VATTRDAVTRRFLALALSAAVVATLVALASEASAAGPATRGEAQAAFQAFFTGGSAIRAHNPRAEGAPGVPIEPPPDGARIYPGVENAVYCQAGWHVVLLGAFDDPAAFGGNKALFDFLSAADIQFVLDAVPLQMKRTSIKRFPHPDPTFSENPLMAVNFGAFLPPGSLSLGTHELKTIYHDPNLDFEFTVAFTVVAC
jgi:hypothetical protein